MKKLILALLLATCMLIPALAQQNGSDAKTQVWDHGDNVSDISYENIPIYQIWDHKDAYVVFYESQDLKINHLTLPKKWTVAGDDGRKKLQFRNKSKGLPSYITVFYRNGDFYKAVVTVSSNRSDPVWAVAPHGYDIGDTDPSTLQIRY